MFGLLPEDVEQPDVEIWEENWTAVLVMKAMGTQWRSGPGGPTGLDYNVLPFVLDTMKVKKSKRAMLLDDLRVMELEALKIMNKPRKQP